MTWWRSFFVGLLVGLGALAVVMEPWRGDEARRVLDFTTMVGEATVQRPAADVFEVTDLTIGGVTRRTIAPTGASRIAWNVTPADRQWLEVDLGLGEEAWASQAHAVLFRIGLSYDTHYEDLIAQVMNPATVEGDRGWLPVRIDLSPYAGRTISLIFNTSPAPAIGSGPAHHAAWGAPALVQR